MDIDKFVENQEVMNTGNPGGGRNPGDAYAQSLSLLRSAYGELSDAFEGLPPSAGWRRRAVKDFVGGVEVGRIEEAVDREFYFLRTDPSAERRAQAVCRIGEGVEYMKKLVFSKIDGRG